MVVFRISAIFCAPSLLFPRRSWMTNCPSKDYSLPSGARFAEPTFAIPPAPVLLRTLISVSVRSCNRIIYSAALITAHFTARISKRSLFEVIDSISLVIRHIHVRQDSQAAIVGDAIALIGCHDAGQNVRLPADRIPLPSAPPPGFPFRTVTPESVSFAPCRTSRTRSVPLPSTMI